MKRRLFSLIPALALLAVLVLPARAAEPVTVFINGVPMATTLVSSRVYGDSTYVPLTDFAAAMGESSVRCESSAAVVSSGGVTVTAPWNEKYLVADERCFYLPQGVKVVEGKTMVPVSALAAAYGLSCRWDVPTGTVRLTTDGSSFQGYDPDALYWLSRIISAESQGEPITGQVAVGNVVLNRVASPTFPNTIYDVIFDTNYGIQFEPTENGTIYLEPAPSAVLAAKMVLEGADAVGDCLYFYNPALSQSTWFDSSRIYYTTIGGHKFYL